MRIRAIRGATTVEADEPELIRLALEKLGKELLEVNEVDREDLVDIIVTVTQDLNSMFAGTAIREQLGLDDVPILGAIEADVTGSPAHCIRVMMHVYSAKTRAEIRHIYHGESLMLRPDLNHKQTEDK